MVNVSTRTNNKSIAIIGAGMSGLCMAIKLKEAGLDNFTIFEKGDQVGGTWRDNTYPGVACDIPSHLYSFSFETKPDWSMVYSPGPEIQSYIETLTDRHKLGAHIEFGSKLTQAKWQKDHWILTFENGHSARFDFLINAMGGLHIPNWGHIEGGENFKGVAFHTARWNHSHDLSGRKVAVIGTAASAIQLIPEIADKVASLDVYQRTPNWILPRPFASYSEKWKKRFARYPLLEKLHRLQIYLTYEVRFPLFRKSGFWQLYVKRMFKKHLNSQVSDKDLQKKLTPNYPVGCKRILASDTYFPALQRDHVNLITDPIGKITPTGILTEAGTLREVDTIIFATGFKPWDQMEGLHIAGKDNLSMSHYLSQGIRAHRTVSMPGFPNQFMLLGPNSALGHNSVIIMIEAQVNYIIQAIQETITQDATVIEADPASAEHFDTMIQHDLQGTVWAGHCKSWYHDEDGRIYTLWPWSTLRYKKEMKKLNPEEYTFSSP